MKTMSASSKATQSKSVAESLGLPNAKRNKFGAKPRTLDGIRFDSQAEARRYAELKLLLDQEQIAELRVHPCFELGVYDPDEEHVRIGSYEADFSYIDWDGQFVVEDVKGGKATKTPLYRWKKKHFEAEWGLRITEVSR
jgi:hypothetical protein